MVARKKVDEQQEPVTENKEDLTKCAGQISCDLVVPNDSPYERHRSILLERFADAGKGMKKLDQAMINKALTLLEASGEGAGDLKIKQIETAIEIYKAVQIL